MLLVALAMLRWRRLPVLAAGVLMACGLLHAGATPLIRDQFDFTPTAQLLGEAQRRGTPVAFLGEYQLQFHFAGRLQVPVAALDEAGARTWASAHPQALIVVNWRDEWREPGDPSRSCSSVSASAGSRSGERATGAPCRRSRFR
jgi:hypothetical protein